MPGEALAFPGVLSPVGLHCPHTPGVFPDQIVVWCLPQVNNFPAYGTLTFGNEGNYVSLINCQVDRITNRMSVNGHLIGLILQDRRWAWRFATITGAYNVRLPDGTLQNEKNPQELATLLLNAMGESGYDVSLLPTSGRPEVYWDAASAPLELDRLCDLYGCEPDLDIPTNTARIRRLNFGPGVPLTGHEKSLSATVDPPQLPQRLRLICGDTVVECLIQMEAVGLDNDGLWKPIDDLSYNPGAWEDEGDWIQFHGVTDPVDRALAVATVGRCFRIKAFPVDSATVPVLGGTISKAAQILPLKGGVLEPLTEAGFPASAIIYAEHYVSGNPDPAENFDGLTVVREPFSYDRVNGVVKFRKPIVKINGSDQWEAARLFLQTSFSIKDASLLLRLREERTFPLGGPFGEVPIKEPGLFRRIRVTYDLSADPPVQTGFTDNLVDVQAEADAILLAAAARYTASTAGVIVYRHTQLVQTNGVIRQVVWTISTEHGWNTVVHLSNDGYAHASRLHDRRMWRQSKTALSPDTWDRMRRILQDQGALL
jgi:hypothetical protein